MKSEAFELGVYGSSQDFFELVFEVQKYLRWYLLFWNQVFAHYLLGLLDGMDW